MRGTDQNCSADVQRATFDSSDMNFEEKGNIGFVLCADLAVFWCSAQPGQKNTKRQHNCILVPV